MSAAYNTELSVVVQMIVLGCLPFIQYITEGLNVMTHRCNDSAA